MANEYAGVKVSDELKEICRRIGSYFQDQYSDSGDAMDKIASLNVIDMALEDGVLTVTTSSPGFWIGKEGSRVEELEKILDLKIKLVEGRSWRDLINLGVDSDYDPVDFFHEGFDDEDDEDDDDEYFDGEIGPAPSFFDLAQEIDADYLYDDEFLVADACDECDQRHSGECG